MDDAFMDAVWALGLPPTESEALFFLQRHAGEDINPSRLARGIHVSRDTTDRYLPRLVKAGYIARDGDMLKVGRKLATANCGSQLTQFAAVSITPEPEQLPQIAVVSITKKSPTGVKRQTEITPEFIEEMVVAFSTRLGGDTGVRDEVTKATNHKALFKAIDKRQYLRTWLNNAVNYRAERALSMRPAPTTVKAKPTLYQGYERVQ